jgi:phage shock protein PspC (stress-responsive transcriptional regulator)
MVYMAEILMVVAGAVGAGLLCYMIWWLLGIL